MNRWCSDKECTCQCRRLGKQGKMQGNSREISTPASLTMLKPLCVTVCVTINCGKFLKKMGILDNLTCPLRNLHADQEVTEPDMEQ